MLDPAIMKMAETSLCYLLQSIHYYEMNTAGPETWSKSAIITYRQTNLKMLITRTSKDIEKRLTSYITYIWPKSSCKIKIWVKKCKSRKTLTIRAIYTYLNCYIIGPKWFLKNAASRGRGSMSGIPPTKSFLLPNAI